jgi:hypothetical protein
MARFDMRSRKKIEQLIEHIEVETRPTRDRHLLGTILKAHEESQHQQQPHTWRIVMRSNTAKLASAAVVLIGIGLFVTILDHMTAPAWAFEQTLAALKNVRAVYTTGRMYDPSRGRDATFEIWAEARDGDPTRSGDCRYREGDDHLCVASEAENITYVYDRLEAPKQEVVYITEGLNRGMYMFPSGDMLAEFKAMAQNWQEEIRKDPETGKSYAYITFSGPEIDTAKYWQIQVDVETKLPVRTAVWFNADRQGQPHYEFTTLEYDPNIPQGCFEFEVPAGAQVVDCREIEKLFAKNPNLGIMVDDLELKEACMKVITAYWQALIAKDWDTVGKIRPLATGQDLTDLQSACAHNEPIGKVNVSYMNHLNDPGTLVEVFCTVQTKGGEKQSLLNVAIQETTGGRKAVVSDAIGPEFHDAK